MNSKQTRIKKAIFSKPTPRNITWNEIVSLLIALGCTMTNRKGSTVAFTKGKAILLLHRPHPQNTLNIYAAQDVEYFLISIGVT